MMLVSKYVRITFETAGGNLVDFVNDPGEVRSQWFLYFSDLPKFLKRMNELKSDVVDPDILKVLLSEHLVHNRG